MHAIELFPKEDTPHSELRFKTELNQKTSNSGHNGLLHIIVSTNTVRPEKYRTRDYMRSSYKALI